MDAQNAINAAISGDWKTALKINLALLKTAPKDIDTLNRLGRAFMETGHKTKASETYAKVLRIDKFNSIAAKNLELLKNSRLSRNTPSLSSPPPVFLEEPGVTKTVTLIRLGDPKTISALHPGIPIQIISRGHSVSAISPQGSYLGRLPDDLSSRLRTFIQSGNIYAAWVKSVDPLKIFVCEQVRCSKYKNTPSFPITEKLAYAAFTPPELVHEEKPVVSTTEEDVDVQPDNDDEPDDI